MLGINRSAKVSSYSNIAKILLLKFHDLTAVPNKATQYLAIRWLNNLVQRLDANN
jgi:hypothetical protein